MAILDKILPWRAKAVGRKEAETSVDIKERLQRIEANNMMMSQVRHFQSANENRRRPDWNVFSLSGDMEAANKLPIIRSRSRLMVDNDAKASGLIHKEVINTIGPRFSVQANIPKRTQKKVGLSDDKVKQLIEDAEEYWRDVVAEPGNKDLDWRRYRSFLSYIHLMFRHSKIDGGLFVRFIYKPYSDRTIPFACRIIEPECIGTPPKMLGIQNIRNGLEFSNDGELVAFHVATKHPGDLNAFGIEYERVPVRNEFGLPQMVFFFSPNRESSSREMPWLQSTLTLLNDVADYKDSELQRKKMEADVAWFCCLNDPDATKEAYESDTAFGNSGGSNINRSEGKINHPKRQIQYLETNEKIEVLDADRPGSNYQAFLDSHDRDIGQGIGRSFERVSNNYGAANFSATRVSGIEDAVCHETDFSLFAPVILKAIWEWSMWSLAIETGDPGYRYLMSNFHRYIKNSWDPESDADAASERIANETSSLVEECNMMGRDVNTVIENRMRVEALKREARKKYGLPESPENDKSIDAAIDSKVTAAIKKSNKKKEDDTQPVKNKEADDE